MKELFLLWLACCGVLVAYGQQRITFAEPDLGKMSLLSRTVSIDSRHDSVYVAYGNERELKALRDLGYDYSLTEVPRETKTLTMAQNVEEMRQWNRYPTYETYVEMMQGFARDYPDLCQLDTIGYSVRNRLILCVRLTSDAIPESAKPQFFYSSTMHGDEIAGFQLMLHLIDTLLSGYGRNAQYTHLLDSVQVFINPLSNPDGTYNGGNDNVTYSTRYNANSVDLNRNYPDPFGTAPLDDLQQENTAMMDYVGRHRFRLAANLHGGSEVLNYPWDSFTSRERQHPAWRWWERVCTRFVDTLRAHSSMTFDEVANEGYLAGGDWYVIPNGRQDYMNATRGILEMTMEISNEKKLSVEELPAYWSALQHPLVDYIHCVLPDTADVGISLLEKEHLDVYPNPCVGKAFLSTPATSRLELFDMKGRLLVTYPKGTKEFELRQPAGIYLLRCGAYRCPIVVVR
ncbi:MAG: M14 family zinc carboxypeptidase [Bacteroidales bacterium]|nr:M14 family zinc carboxypeptidase [Bacteroidales bacterium]